MAICIAWAFLALHSGASAANSQNDAQLFDVNIPSMNAADALNSLAEQTGAIMLFPYDLAESRQANKVVGRYTLTGALSELLRGSGLSSGLSDKSVIQIALDEPEDQHEEDGEMVAEKVPFKTKLGAFVVSLFMTTGANAQDPGEDGADGAIEEILVTGSRLKRDSFNLSTPLVSVDSEALQDGGLGSVAMILVDEVPSIFESSSNTNTQSSIGSTGLTTINLRQLGTNRTLTLIDGRRTVSNSYSGNYVSLNTIPRGMIDRVEVVTGGSTATYGSDAIAGVVNIITQQDREGFSVYARGGQTSEGGGEEFTLNADYGMSFADGRGYLFAGVTYDEEFGIDNKDRARAAIEADFDYNTTLLCNEMQTATGDQCMRDVPDPADWRDRSDGTAGGVFSEGSGAWWYDENGLNTGFSEERDGLFSRIWDVVLVPNDTLSAAVKLNYDFTDNTSGYFQLQYNRNKSFNFKSPEDDSEASDVATIDPVTGVPDEVRPGHLDFDNPFVLESDIALDPNYPANWNGDWDRRFFEVGNITTDNERTTWRTWAGLQGTMFDGNWDWDASVGFGQFEQLLIRSNELDVRKMAQALDAEYAADGVTIQCADPAARAAGCVPLNILGVGSITPEMADWIRYTPILNPTIKQVNVLAYVTGELFDMPAGAVGSVFGVEYRQDDMDMQADDGSNYGGITYNIVPDIQGDMDVVEVFSEFSFPLADRLTADVSVRVADYSHKNIDTVFSYTSGLMWEVAEGYSLRANYSRAQRAPDLTELFSPERGDYDSYTDICDEVVVGSSEPGHANCLLDPRIAAIVAADGIFLDDNNGYSPSIGNPNLFEETADTYTLGFSIAPTFLDGFQLAVDYYNIEIEDAIIEVENVEIMKQCYASSVTLGGANPFCDDITRDDEGQIIKILQRQFNLDSQSTSGFDVALDYVFDLSDFGELELTTHWTHIIEHEAVFEGVDGPELTDYNNQLDFGIFDDVATASLTWRHNDWRVRWRTKYKGPIVDHNERVDDYLDDFAENDVNCAAADPVAAGCITNPEVPAYLFYPSYTTHDLSLSFDMEMNDGSELNMFAGVRNLFDNDVFVPRTGDAYEGGIGNYDSKFGGGIGRFFFFGAEVIFE